MIYGYCRISTPQQSLDRQIRNINKLYPSAMIIKETYTGTSNERPEWARLTNKVSAGDSIVFDSVSRMSRNAEDGIKQYLDLYSRNVNLIFLKEPHINSAVYQKAMDQHIKPTGTAVDKILEGINEYMRILATEQIKLAFDQAEKEVMDLHQRTSEGMLTAKLNGAQIGAVKGKKLVTQKSIEKKQQILKHCRDFGGNLSDSELIAMTGLDRKTYYKYKKELKDDQ